MRVSWRGSFRAAGCRPSPCLRTHPVTIAKRLCEISEMAQLVWFSASTCSTKGRRPGDRHSPVLASHREQPGIPTAARPRSPADRQQAVPDCARFYRRHEPAFPFRFTISRSAWRPSLRHHPEHRRRVSASPVRLFDSAGSCRVEDRSRQRKRQLRFHVREPSGGTTRDR